MYHIKLLMDVLNVSLLHFLNFNLDVFAFFRSSQVMAINLIILKIQNSERKITKKWLSHIYCIQCMCCPSGFWPPLGLIWTYQSTFAPWGPCECWDLLNSSPESPVSLVLISNPALEGQTKWYNTANNKWLFLVSNLYDILTEKSSCVRMLVSVVIRSSFPVNSTGHFFPFKSSDPPIYFSTLRSSKLLGPLSHRSLLKTA